MSEIANIAPFLEWLAVRLSDLFINRFLSHGTGVVASKFTEKKRIKKETESCCMAALKSSDIEENAFEVIGKMTTDQMGRLLFDYADPVSILYDSNIPDDKKEAVNNFLWALRYEIVHNKKLLKELGNPNIYQADAIAHAIEIAQRTLENIEASRAESKKIKEIAQKILENIEASRAENAVRDSRIIEKLDSIERKLEKNQESYDSAADNTKGNKTAKGKEIKDPMIHLYDVQKEILKDTEIIGIRGSTKLRDILPDTFIDSKVKVGMEGPKSFSLFVQKHEGNSVAILAGPGQGKSTVMKALIVNDYWKDYKDTFFYYIHASDLLRYAENIALDENFARNLLSMERKEYRISKNKKIILLVDSLDETSPGRTPSFMDVWKGLKPHFGSRLEIWIGCRTDHYMRHYDNSLSISNIVRLCDWGEESLEFIEKVEKKCKKVGKLGPIINQWKEKNHFIDNIMKNPLHLTLLLFCLADGESSNHDIKNSFDLYKLFYDKWMERHGVEDAKKISEYRQHHVHVAKSLYAKRGVEQQIDEIFTEGIPSCCADKAFLDMLLIREKESDKEPGKKVLKAKRFWHESFGEYLIASDLTDFFLSISDASEEIFSDPHLSTIYNYDVNAFIKEAFESQKPEDSRSLCRNLSALYEALLAAGKNPKMRWNLLYYIGRIVPMGDYMGEVREQQKKVLLNALNSETEPAVKRTAMISLINCSKGCPEIEKVELEYLQTMTYKSESDVINRSTQLVYYGDAGYDFESNRVREFGSLSDFKDVPSAGGSMNSWDRIRFQLLNGISSRKDKYILYRLWDYRTLRLFYESRQWNDVTKEDAEIVRDSMADSNIYCEEKRQAVLVEKELLLKEMSLHLKA